MERTIDTKNHEHFVFPNKMKICIFPSEAHAREFNQNIVLPKTQVNSDNIFFIEHGNEDLEHVDGLHTENREIVLGVKTSDCAAICLSDGKKIGVIHVGWRGLTNGIINKALNHFDKENLVIYVAPFLHTFEIKRDFCYESLYNVIGDRFFEEREDKLFFNFKNALENLLPEHTVWDSRNTEEDLSLPSNRRGIKYNFVTAVEFYKD